MKWYTIGSITIPVSQLALGITFLLIGAYLWWKKEKDLLDVYGNTVFLFIIVWKFSIIIFSFSMVIEAPMSLLYFNGGERGLWLAVMAALMYMAWKWSPQQWYDGVKIWMMVIVLFEMLLAMLSGQAGLLDTIRLAGGAMALSFLIRAPLQVLWLFTLWQLLFESWAGEVVSTTGLLYIGVTIYFVMIRRKQNIG
ncbi:hypothetical protein [Bacillus sp. FJAT-52991]|uniref:Uncharacterized protein n=1 Tax=Bacillus kandeliae TaxID=3129297 RepID=A0ABZ2N4S6_9BACI